MTSQRPDLGFVHRYLPATAPQDGTTLLLLHGTGGNEDDLLPVGRALDPHAALLSPRGAVLERGMPRFFRRLAEGVFDLDDLTARTHDLATFVEQAATTYGFNPQRVVAVGFSNGANIAASLLLLHPGVLAGAVLFRPMVPLQPPTPPDLSGCPVLVAAGQDDPIVPRRESERLVALLQGYGASTTVHWAAGGHGLSAPEVAVAHEWLAALR